MEAGLGLEEHLSLEEDPGSEVKEANSVVEVILVVEEAN